MDPTETMDASNPPSAKIETADNNPTQPSDMVDTQPPVEFSSDGNPLFDSIATSVPSNGDSSVLSGSDTNATPQDKTMDVVGEIEESSHEDASVRINIPNEQSGTPDSTMDQTSSQSSENREDRVPSSREGMLSPTTPLSPTRSSLSSKGTRAKQRKRVSFNEIRDGKPPFTTTSIWPRSDEFSVAAGEEAVKRYVRECWSLEESWLHCVDYMGEEPASSGRQKYRVKFSQPTRRRPIPAHTASVYFTLVVGERGQEVQVWWVLEGQRLLHRPGEERFKEQWLRDILEAKAIICVETLF